MEAYKIPPPPGEGSSAEEIWRNTPRVASMTLATSIVFGVVAFVLWLVGMISGIALTVALVIAAAFGLRMVYGLCYFVGNRNEDRSER
ncbi:MAG: hypothetical protein WBP12_05420 [Candidatus Saccharimonas sp.]